MNTLMQVRDSYGRMLNVFGWIAGVLTFAVMCLVVANVVLRYGLNTPIAGALELTEGALPLIIFLSLALTQYNGGHIRVVLLTSRMPEPLSRILSVIAMLAGALLFAWAAYAGWLSAEKSYAIGEMKRGSIRYPVWPIKYAVCFGMMLLSVQFVLDALAFAMGLKMADPELEEIE